MSNAFNCVSFRLPLNEDKCNCADRGSDRQNEQLHVEISYCTVEKCTGTGDGLQRWQIKVIIVLIANQINCYSYLEELEKRKGVGTVFRVDGANDGVHLRVVARVGKAKEETAH